MNTPAPSSTKQAGNFTAPTILAIILLVLLLGCGMWLLVYGTNLEQKTIITPNTTDTPPAPSPADDVQSID